MSEAVRIHVRYDVPNEKGETRRERNLIHNEPSPAFIVPEEGTYLWGWFNDLNESVTRIINGTCRLIPPSEFIAWSELTRNIVYSNEYDILRAMDVAYCAEMDKELADRRTRMEEEHIKNLEDAKKAGA